MKKYIILFLAGCCTALSGCVDLDQLPQSPLTPKTITYSKADLDALGNGLYRALWYGNYGFNCRLASLTLGGDDMIGGKLDKTRVIDIDQLHLSTSVSDTDVSGFYNNMYSVIQRANQMIEGVIASEGNSDAVKQLYLGEAYFMRALSYFYLVRMFGEVPAITDPNAERDVFGSTTIIRNRIEDIYDKIIIPDLKLAETFLPVQGRGKDGGVVHNAAASQYAAKTCLADVYLAVAGYPLKRTEYYALAAAKAKEVIDVPGSHKLLDSYEALWKEANKNDDTEHLFVLTHSVQYDQASNYGISYLAPEENGGWSDYQGDSAFYERYPADQRKKFVYKTSVPVKVGAITINKDFRKLEMRSPLINKYRDYGITSAQANGITPIYRFADALLIYAEAKNLATGADDLAYTCINRIRQRANGGVPNDLAKGQTKEAFNQAVFDEWGWEFVFEFKRWFQLVRTEKVFEANQANPRVKTALTRYGVTADNRQVYLFPLPYKEVQMCGWSNNEGY